MLGSFSVGVLWKVGVDHPLALLEYPESAPMHREGNLNQEVKSRAPWREGIYQAAPQSACQTHRNASSGMVNFNTPWWKGHLHGRTEGQNHDF
jgi:hypothetical protein